MALSLEEGEERISTFVTMARKSGLRITPQRLEIFREVAFATEHPDVEAVFASVRTRMPTVSLDTVYRTLWWLKDSGLVSLIGAGKGGTRFDPNTKAHHHFVCLRCGSIQDFYDSCLDSLEIPTQAELLGAVQGVNVEVRGECKLCLAKAALEGA
ncbi:MAG: Fur family transcriptional regulator peroxide stress response regulator [Spirochaetes bacterium]|nr:MAG: Fur family transcriptional regulator peroxide stress response regulator [Spirochaetota bacterium]